MPFVDMSTLTAYVQAILDDPRATPVTGDDTLDAALAHLAERHRAMGPLTATSPLGFWHPAPRSAHAHGY